MAIIKISDGNAFKLRVTAMVNSVQADLNVITNMIVNFVRRGRLAQPHGLDSNGRLVISNDGSLARGIYGVEITGYHDGKPWRHYIKDAFKIVDENEDADTPSVVDDVPVYDLSDNMSFGGDGVTAEYVNAAISAHDGDENAHPELQQMIAQAVNELRDEIEEGLVEAGKVNDVTVNGNTVLDPNTKVANITVPTKVSDLPNDSSYQTESQVNAKVAAAAVNDVNVSVETTNPAAQPSAEKTFENGVLDITFRNIKGEKGDPLTWNDLTQEQKDSLVGAQGASAVFDPQTGNILATLENKVGGNDANAMTQKAVSKEIDIVREVLGIEEVHHDTDFSEGTRIVSCETGAIQSGTGYANEIAITSNTYEVTYPCRGFEGQYGYAFVKSDGTFVSGGHDTNDSFRTISRDDILDAYGKGATKLRLTLRDNATAMRGYDVKTLATGGRFDDIDTEIESVKDVAQATLDAISTAEYHHDVDFSKGVRNVSSDTGEISAATGSGKYAEVILLDSSLVEIVYNSDTFKGNFGYAFVDVTNDTDTPTLCIGTPTKAGGTITIGKAEIAAAMAQGAVALRISIKDNPKKPVGYTTKKVADGIRVDKIEEDVQGINERVAALEEGAPASSIRLIGSPIPYVADVDDSQVLEENTKVKENADDNVGIGIFNSTADLYAAFDALVTAHPDWLSRETDLGEAPHAEGDTQDYTIRHYCLRYQHPTISADPNRSWPSEYPNLWDDDTYKMRRIIINMSVHSLEKYSTLGAYLAIKAILESHEPWAMFIKSNFILEIVPCLNPWGLNNNSSENYNGANINRTYNSNIQPENECMIDLIQSLMGKGLVGAIDTHNCSDRGGYIVAAPRYTYYDYYAVLTQQIGAIVRDAMVEVESNNNFRLWQPSDTGQLHDYADQQGLLGCTYEIKSTYKAKGSLLTKSILINLIQAFGTYE